MVSNWDLLKISTTVPDCGEEDIEEDAQGLGMGLAPDPIIESEQGVSAN